MCCQNGYSGGDWTGDVQIEPCAIIGAAIAAAGGGESVVVSASGSGLKAELALASARAQRRDGGRKSNLIGGAC